MKRTASAKAPAPSALAGEDRQMGSLRRAIAALGVSAGVVASSMQPAGADPAPPSSDAVADAAAEVGRDQNARDDAVSRLAAANNEIDRLDGEVEAKQQAADKAIEDVRAAQSAAEGARRRASAARDELRGAQAQSQSVQDQADALVQLMYSNGTSLSPELALVGAPSVGDGLDRAAVVGMLASDQRRALEAVLRARNDEANRAAAANAADREAARAITAAEQAKRDADQAVAGAKAAFDEQRAKRDAIAQARDDAQRKLDEAQSAARSLADQRAKAEQAKEASPEQAEAGQQSPGQQPQGAAQPETPARDHDAAEGSAPPAQGPAAGADVEQQLAQQVAAQDPGLSQLILYGATPAAAQAPPPTAGGGYVPRLYGQQAVETVIRRGLTQIGRIYSWGGGSAYGPTRGIHDGGVADRYGDYMISGYDCSGLMIYAFAGAGILLPHYTGYQYRAGRHVPAAQMRRGDLIFYGPNASEHVALYLGNGWMLESPQSGERVHVTRLRTGGMCPDVVRMF
ncbi:NLP/P60 protein [Segniliparus rotundus DSM 44985]|uniref:NLP/P60 protein n=1 Tax=Segniliparus rotundus (strain ATCC BAA-972 / CDC 1076 / CIP 108378 / DSM 44985 / JCM 13578) TaxID=640132 RepID=D6Z7K9_SEGRD|nr:NlpC/P60 family protein [Segniliparus rotundus]ADG97939.1 NLP/P60 protein [Segniliparus rotundus DSM 44985]